MSKHDDFIDDYIEYRIFEDSFKSNKTSGSKPTSPPPIRMTKKSSDLGCGGWIALICIAIVLISIFGSCSRSSSKSYSSSYKRSYSTSSYSSSSRSSLSGYSSSSKPSTSNGYKTYSSSSKSISSSSDPYDAKSYAHPDDLYYDYPDDFWDYEDAEDYWEKHQDD